VRGPGLDLARHKKTAPVLALRHRLAWRVAPKAIRFIARVMWKFRIEAEAAFPDPPFIIAANHLSFLDPPLVGAAWGQRLKFVTLADLFGNYPLLDFTLESFEAIRVKRGTIPLAAVRQSLAHLAEGGVVCLFPEGTRAVRWGEVRPLPGAAWLAVRAGVPIVGMAAIGTDRVFGIDNKLHRGRVRIKIGPAFYPIGSGRAAVDDLTRRWSEWMAGATHPEPGTGRRP
jgi:1-acyl-sn-glycerol-3-phosphate acyltransferase